MGRSKETILKKSGTINKNLSIKFKNNISRFPTVNPLELYSEMNRAFLFGKV